MPSNKNVVVLGAGVVGLTTALKVQEQGRYNVTIVAETLPSDPKSIRYTSHWAGAHHVSLAGEDKRQQEMDQETFHKMWDLSSPGGEAEGCFLRIPQIEYYHEEFADPHPLSIMPEFKRLDKNDLTPDTDAGISFTTISIDTPRYLNWLMAKFMSLGGTVVRQAVHHISQIVEGGPRVYTNSRQALQPDAVIVCVGIGARGLGGVEDSTVYPIRGQTVLVRAPWIKFGKTVSSPQGLWTYIIPRASGDIIIGGTKAPNDWYPVPRQETTDDILKRGFALCPELAPPEVREARTPTIDDIIPLVIEEGCGLRPARKDGIRLEVERIAAGRSQVKVPVIYNYGHGGYGYQSSWGSASIALRLLIDALA